MWGGRGETTMSSFLAGLHYNNVHKSQTMTVNNG